MTAAELIAKLSSVPPHYKVCMGRGGRGSWRNVEEVRSAVVGAMVDTATDGTVVVEFSSENEGGEDAVVLGMGKPFGWKGKVL